MSNASETPSPLPLTVLAATALLTFSATATFAQNAVPLALVIPPGVTQSHAELPDAPAPALVATLDPEPGSLAGASSSSVDASSSSVDASSPSVVADPAPQTDIAKTAPTSRPLPPANPPVAGPYQMTIGAGQVGPALTNRQKVVSGARDSISPFTFFGEVISAGYSHATNGSPNYGTNSLAFGSRAGASFARGSSQNLFTESVLAPVLHEDVRYYQLGSSVPFFERLFYAGTRPLITRTDGGHRTPNISLLGGYLGAAFLSKTYNPVLNQSNDEVLKIYGTSIGGAAIGDVVTEFLPGFLQVLHLSRFSHL